MGDARRLRVRRPSYDAGFILIPPPASPRIPRRTRRAVEHPGPRMAAGASRSSLKERVRRDAGQFNQLQVGLPIPARDGKLHCPSGPQPIPRAT